MTSSAPWLRSKICPSSSTSWATASTWKRAKLLTVELGLEDAVTFHGQQPRMRVDDFYRNADVFMFPSYREPGGNAPFEAMSYGLPLVVADRGGPAAAVPDSCGYRLDPQDPEQYARDIAVAVRSLVLDSTARRAMGDAARRRAQDHDTWDHRVQAMEKIYADVRSTTAETPLR